MTKKSKLANWGNSKAVRLSAEILNFVGFKPNDELIIEVDEKKRVIIEKAKDTPSEYTIEELFRAYEDNGEAEPIKYFEPTGNELW
jgi:antitoxin MazE